jgi:hypothetical protein
MRITVTVRCLPLIWHVRCGIAIEEEMWLELPE